ncbi:MAG: SpoIIE family protein phosphatase [Thermoguttaceae bacterium]|nr:SpoIIE family protein phosphatase [Thermoguttaceae bacterium]
MAYLLFINPATSKEVSIPIKPGGILLGRHPYCEVRINDAKVSREHARIDQADTGVYFEDLHSRNGSLLNGIPAHGREQLFDGDQILICNKLFTFHSDDPRDIRKVDNAATRKSLTDSSLLFRENEENDQFNITSSIRVVSTQSLSGMPSDTQQDRDDPVHEVARLKAKLQAITELSRSLGKIVDMDDLRGVFLRKLLMIFPSAEMACFIIQGEDEEFQLVDFVRRDEDKSDSFRVSRAILDEVIRTRAGILSDDIGKDSRFQNSQSLIQRAVHSAMAVPVYNSSTEQLIGIFQLYSEVGNRAFLHEDLDLLVSIANQLTVYYENITYHSVQMQEKMISQEMAVAFKVQKGFLPTESPHIPHYRFYDYYHPARYLGGDYFDYIPLPDGRLAVTIGDVSGKGISAALLMAKLSSEVRHRILLEPDLPKLVAQLNKVFCAPYWDNRFITFLIVVLDPNDNSLRLVNAGHPYPIVSSLDCQTRELINRGSFPLGVSATATYEEDLFTFEPGDILAVMSDGLSDAMDEQGNYFTQQRVREYLKNKESFTAEELGGSLMYAIREFAGHTRQSDDQCLVMIGRDKLEE